MTATNANGEHMTRREIIEELDNLHALIAVQAANLLELEKTLAQMAELEGVKGEGASGYNLESLYGELIKRRRSHGALKANFNEAKQGHKYDPERGQSWASFAGRKRDILERMRRNRPAQLLTNPL